jgi:hypothetical protein
MSRASPDQPTRSVAWSFRFLWRLGGGRERGRVSKKYKYARKAVVIPLPPMMARSWPGWMTPSMSRSMCLVVCFLILRLRSSPQANTSLTVFLRSHTLSRSSARLTPTSCFCLASVGQERAIAVSSGTITTTHSRTHRTRTSGRTRLIVLHESEL